MSASNRQVREALLLTFMPRRGHSNTMARRYKGRPDTFRTDLVLSKSDLKKCNTIVINVQSRLIYCKTRGGPTTASIGEVDIQSKQQIGCHPNHSVAYTVKVGVKGTLRPCNRLSNFNRFRFRGIRFGPMEVIYTVVRSIKKKSRKLAYAQKY